MAAPAPSRQVRGNSYDRAARRQFLIDKYGLCTRSGAVYWILCYHCKRRFRATRKRWDVDRWPLCGHAGGRYTRDREQVAETLAGLEREGVIDGAKPALIHVDHYPPGTINVEIPDTAILLPPEWAGLR
jgi:hypothetical protein